MLRLLTNHKATAPALWGKHQSHADFVSHHVRPGEDDVWQVWLQTRVFAEMYQETSYVKVVHSIEAWEKSTTRRDTHIKILRNLPAAFILPPSTLIFSENRYVIGAISRSSDKAGRVHPLIIYQTVTREWLKTFLSSRETRNSQDWLFWLTRCLALYQAGENQGLSFEALSRTVDTLWQKFQPRFAFFKMSLAQPSQQQCLDILKNGVGEPAWNASLHSNNEIMARLQGVKFLPWVDWPQRLFQEDTPIENRSAFWQQDPRGGYIAANESLASLWRVE